MNGVSVCITAYNAQDYIEECLCSVASQTWFKTHDNWEIIVGIDGCDKTLQKVKSIMNEFKNLRVMMMDSNKGTYITSNTIMSNAKYSNLFRFDSDDIMLPNLVETIMNKKEDCPFVRYKFRNFGKDQKTGVAWGTIYISKDVFDKYGGYMPWPCGADSEIYYRLVNFEKIKTIDEVLMLRRVHEESLTQSKKTGMKSLLRKKYQQIINSMKINPVENPIIDCVKNTYSEIVSECNDNFNEKSVNYYINMHANDEDENIHSKKPTKKEKTRIQQLREDIEAGRVIKVPTTTGFIWKRVK